MDKGSGTLANGECGRETADEVALFSGGLDSLAGALQATIGDKRRVALVSHRSSTKKEPAVEQLVTDLRTRCGADRLFHVPVWITKDEHLGREYTQRSRSFLYAALGTTVASMLGRDGFSFYENGVTSLNLPVSPQLVGSRATRTTHPKAIEGFTTFLSALLKKPFAVRSPFIWRTKTDIVKMIADLGCRDLIRHSRSCTRTFEATKLWPHCGTCSQCVDRRFAVLAAGLADEDPVEAYKVDLLTGERDDGERARKAVLAAIRRPMEVLKKDHPGLWRHLFKHLKTGTFCQYSPEPAVTWVTA